MDAYGHLLADGSYLTTRLPNGAEICCDLRDHVQRHLWLAGIYEPIEAFLFTQLLALGMVVIDAGANVGQYTLLASTGVGENGQVHSFEPIAGNLECLREHVRLNELKNVRLNHAALWRASGDLTFRLPDGSARNSGAYRAHRTEKSTPGSVQALSLDDYAEDQKLSRLDIVKLDVEGSEPFVLLGAERSIRKFSPHILMEVNRAALAAIGSSVGELWEVATQLGYRAWQIGSDETASGYVASFDHIQQQNVILHVRPLPRQVQTGWTERSCMTWARSNW
jgi:FkbM family methyltransferase